MEGDAKHNTSSNIMKNKGEFSPMHDTRYVSQDQYQHIMKKTILLAIL